MTRTQSHRLSALLVAALLLPGCGRSQAKIEAEEAADNARETARLEAKFGPPAAFHAGYTVPPGWKTECFGRSLLDVPGEIEWGTADPRRPQAAGAGLTDKVYTKNDVWHVDGEVLVSATARGDKATMMGLARKHHESEVRRAEQHWREEVSQLTSQIERWSAEVVDPSVDETRRKELQSALPELKEDLAKAKRHLEGIESYSPLVDIGVPDSLAFRDGPGLVIYLWRDQRIYRFLESATDSNKLTYEQVEAKLRDIVKRFRVRQTFEIPSEPGVCIPHGFIADDGTAPFRMKNTFRVKDAPNVTYTVYTGKNPPDMARAAILDAIASTLPLGLGLEKHVTRRLGPKDVKIGAFIGPLGGFEVTGLTNPETSYQVNAGHPGVQGSNLFPFMTFEMVSYRKGEDPQLMQPAPPLEESLKRLEGIMYSMRLRPTSANVAPGK
jgi:hypothetical protein